MQIERKTGLNMQWRAAKKQHFVHAAVFVIVSVCIKMSVQLKQTKNTIFTPYLFNSRTCMNAFRLLFYLFLSASIPFVYFLLFYSARIWFFWLISVCCFVSNAPLWCEFRKHLLCESKWFARVWTFIHLSKLIHFYCWIRMRLKSVTRIYLMK